MYNIVIFHIIWFKSNKKLFSKQFFNKNMYIFFQKNCFEKILFLKTYLMQFLFFYSVSNCSE